MSTLNSPPHCRAHLAACPVIVPAHLLASGAAKVRDHHLDRKAVVYIRQSSPQQVAEHKESTAHAICAGRCGRGTGLGPRPRRDHRRGPRTQWTDGRGSP